MTITAIFARHVVANMDLPCPATQEAIDRLIVAEGFRGRVGFVEAMHSPIYRRLDFLGHLMNGAWKDADIERATGHGRDWWIDLMGKVQ